MLYIRTSVVHDLRARTTSCIDFPCVTIGSAWSTTAGKLGLTAGIVSVNRRNFIRLTNYISYMCAKLIADTRVSSIALS